MRAFYSQSLDTFLSQPNTAILGVLTANNNFALENTQRDAWIEQIQILKKELVSLGHAHVIFEYTIPRIGKRIDCVIIYQGIIFLLEFKVGMNHYPSYAIDQVMDYALDLKNFHAESIDRIIVPILVSTAASSVPHEITMYEDHIVKPIRCNCHNIASYLNAICSQIPSHIINPDDWINSVYKPTPTIIEAAQALYTGHSVAEISRSDAGAINLGATTTTINTIIKNAKNEKKKVICFITGVPGAGKTLAGLNIANERHRFDEDEHAVFLSGNGPLVAVLQEALARNECSNSITKIKKSDALRKAKAFIQNIHHFRDDALNSENAPIEKVAIFDEAQRAWTREMTSSFMTRKKGCSNFTMSEPEFLISVMDRHTDWAVIICLVGGGQEINSGEAGLPEWFLAIRDKFPHWEVILSGQLCDEEYTRGEDLLGLLDGIKYTLKDEMHLSVSIRSFRDERVSEFVKKMLDVDTNIIHNLYNNLSKKYSICLTRDLKVAKNWIRNKARGNERYGMIASSGAIRLKPMGIWIQSKIDAPNWFLNDKYDVRSSYYLEDVATEFDIQGLELDWTIVAWDADFRFHNEQFEYHHFTGKKWC
ncbi:MAG: DUF2075 domain-containing protein, partial [Armatimonadota bacterium]